jgi:cytochrome c2
MKLPFFLLFLAAQYLIACSGDSAQAVATLTPAEQKGQSIYISRCAHCHALEPETVLVGPSLAGVANRASNQRQGSTAEEYLEESILYPKAYIVEGFTDAMPANFGKELTLEELNALVAFLLSLK